MAAIPSNHEFIEPQWKILKERGTCTLDELAVLVAASMQLSDEQMKPLHNDGPRTEYEYRMAWARTLGKQAGYFDNPTYGVWVNTIKGNQAESIDSREIVRTVSHLQREKRARRRGSNTGGAATAEDDIEGSQSEDEDSWMDELISTIMQISPVAFEKLCRRLLIEVGFEEVEVTQQSRDGGIDGHGKLRTMDLFTQQVAFQSKRYKPGNVIGSSQIQGFRGSIEGMTKMGVVITTSSFSRDAVKEAARPGATEINLLDGIELCRLLKKYKIGVSTEQKEDVTIISEFFESLE